MRRIYIIPGYRQDRDTPWFVELKGLLEANHFQVEILDVTWNYRVMSQYIEEVESQLWETRQSYILWFSFGAMVALKLGQKLHFKKIILCSLSPYFTEDLDHLPVFYQRALWSRRWNDFKNNFSARLIRNTLWNSYTLIYGWDERIRLKYRASEMIKKLAIEDVWIVEWVWHRIGNSEYIKKIINLVIK